MKKEKAAIEDYARMCNKSVCSKCPLGCSNNGKKEVCVSFMQKFPDKANEIILKWCEEHPTKTRQTEFLEMFPNAYIGGSGILNVNPCCLDKEVKCNGGECSECRRIYWSEEVEE